MNRQGAWPCLMLLLLSGVSQGQDRLDHEGIAERLRLTVKVGKTEYLPFEPIFVTLILENPTQAPITLIGKAPNIDACETRTEVSSNGGKFEGTKLTGSVACGAFRETTLAPGERMIRTSEGCLNWGVTGPNDLGADQIGSRVLRVRQPIGFGPDKGKIQSNEVKFRITKPTSKADREALARLAEGTSLHGFQERQNLRKLIRDFPQSRYAPIAAFRLGRWYCGWSAAGARIDSACAVKAFSMLGFAIRRSNDDQLKLRAHLQAAELYFKTGNKKAAKTHLCFADKLDNDESFREKRTWLRSILTIPD